MWVLVYIFTSTKPRTMRKQRFVLLAFCLLGLLVPTAHSTSVDSPSYISKFKDIAIREMHRSGIPASITLAQAIHESAWGEGTLARSSNNYFGIKCKDYWTGPTYYIEDDDYQNGRLVKSCFRAYDDVESSFVDHSNFLRDNPRYQVLFTYQTTDYTAWARGLQNCGYATDQKYASKLIRTIERYQLDQYDLLETTVPQWQQAAPSPPIAAAPRFNLDRFLPSSSYAPTAERPLTSTLDDAIPQIAAEGYEVPAAYVLPDDYQRGANRVATSDEAPLFLGEPVVASPNRPSPVATPPTPMESHVLPPRTEAPASVRPPGEAPTTSNPAPATAPASVPNDEAIIRLRYAGDSRASQLGRQPRVSDGRRR